MSKRRLDRLEGSLGPKEAVLRWMDEAHAFGSLPAYVASLADRPETAHPFVALPRQVEKAVYGSMRGQRSGFVREVTREAVGDTVFLLRLVIAINVHIEGVLQVERLRHLAVLCWSRVLDATSSPGDKAGRADWQLGVVTLHGTLMGTERARAAAEARHIDGHDCLFPELASAWADLLASAELLAAHEPGPDAQAAMGLAEQAVDRVVRMARADGLEASGRVRAADEMADRVARMLVGGGADG